MVRLGRVGFLAVAVVFHLVYVWSIFDIYFVSPIVTGMREYHVESSVPPAKRLFLVVGDGLRADKAFQSFPDPSPSASNSSDALTPRPLAPFLRSRVLSHGTFGVSHTRVPTESRPGHVALIAGLYEDVSAVTTGWKLNPVNFDSVFNRSRHTWSWGSPDILPMFQAGAVSGRVDADTYGAEAEDFTQDATALDVWVFDRVKRLFADARTNATLNEALRQDGNVFFLHLLGLDTTGHAYRPYSREYLHNIQVVDKGVQEIAELVEAFYDDDGTAFVFTADHGMSDGGMHGDGHPDNTRTPLIAWGSGVAKPVLAHNVTARGHEDGFSSDWGLDRVQRNDVSQADIAALMAYLAGLAFPVNSVGELPLAYIAAPPEAKAKAILANAQAILEMYRVKEAQKQRTELRYAPFAALGDTHHSVSTRVERIRGLIAEHRYEESIAEADTLIKLGLAGLRYLQTYDWLFLRTLVTAGYLGWIAFALTTVVDMHVLHGQAKTSRTIGSILCFSSLFVGLFSLLYARESSWTYYAYAVFPVVFWEEVWARRGVVALGKQALLGGQVSREEYIRLGTNMLAVVGVLEALVQSYFHREVYTICYLAAVSWPFFYGVEFVKEKLLLVATWTGCCVAMSVFTLLPAVKVENINLILIGGILMFGTGSIYLMFDKSIEGARVKAAVKPSSLSRIILGVQVGLIGLSMLVTRSSVASLQARTGLPLGTQVVGWLVLAASLSMPFLHRLQPNSNYIHRLAIMFLTFSPVFIILTISYEGLFYFFFCATLVTWVRLEHHVYVYTSRIASPAVEEKNRGIASPAPASSGTQSASSSVAASLAHKNGPQHRAITLADARISLFFLFLVQSAFFSTGNIASISAFSLDAVYRLIPVFDPFSQGALLLLKLMIPFAVISANLGILNRRLGVAPSALFMVVAAMSDVMTLNFFYMVRDEGSWLDIGTSITHFVIASLLCVFVSGLEFVSELFVGGVEFEAEGEGRAGGAVGGIDVAQ